MELPLLALKFYEEAKVAFRLECTGVSFPEQIQKFCFPQVCWETFEFCTVLIFQVGKENVFAVTRPLHFQQFCRENGGTPRAAENIVQGLCFLTSYFYR